VTGTFGVEEFLLVDPDSGEPVDGAGRVLDAASELPNAAPDAALQPELSLITRTYAGIVADYQCCGCHVHVGVPGRETAVAVVNHLAPWLPTPLALSVNSAFEHGRDTGYGSWRMITQSRFPGFGIAPWFASGG
jgi:glutamate---cysteine ligase / carboxylate-amine ligase